MVVRRAEFKQIAVVGSGSFGRVFKVQHRLLGIEYAVKRSTHPFTTPAVRRAWLQVYPHAGAHSRQRVCCTMYVDEPKFYLNSKT